MKYCKIAFTALVAAIGFAAMEARADNMASIAITPATGEVTLVPRWAIGGNLSGFHLMSQDLSLGGGANQFYSIKGTAIPLGGDIAAFTRYIAGSGAATNHEDIGSKLTPNSYSALTSADPDIGYGAVNFYFIHHKDSGDYFTAIVPSSGTASAVTDLKPMSGPGGPATLGDSGYFGLTFAAANLGYGLNNFYYLRTDPVTGFTKFGTLDPALLGTSADKFDLGIGGHNALSFTGTDVGFGTDKMYYLRLDPITGFTILGTLHPVTGRASDIANLGSVYSTLTFVPGDVGFGSGQFYTTGAVNPTWQSVSFAAIDDRAIGAGSFTIKPTASSTLPVTLHVVAGSTGAASISAPVAGVFTVTPTAPGLITLQATQVGATAPTPFEYNMLRQSFTASGVATLAITTQPTAQSAVEGSSATFSVVASGSTALSYQWRKAGVNINANASATTDTLVLPNVQAADAVSYDVVVTNASGSIFSNPVALTVTAAAPAPIVTNSPLTAGATTGSPFNFTITASGSPTSFSASPLPAGLSVNTATGAISGTPTTAGSTAVLLGATNGSGTGNATLTITVAAAGVAPTVTNDPLTAGATVGTAFSFTITASGSPTSYSASPLPAGLSVNTSTGAITGTPSTAGSTAVTLGATNGIGTGNATLTITVAAAGTAPVITNSPLTKAGTVGMPFSFTVTATGSPTTYTASPLPAGLSIVASTGAITGTPTTAGSTAVTLSATNGFGTGTATLTVSVAASSGVAPVFTSANSASGTVGSSFSFAIAASGSPTSYTASPLPAGLSVNSSTGAITGTPTTAGSTSVSTSATNPSGTTTSTLTLTMNAATIAGSAPVFSGGGSAPGSSGTPFTYPVTASGSPTGYTASGLPPGLTIDSTTGVISGTPTVPGTYAVTIGATNETGTTTRVVTITVATALFPMPSGIAVDDSGNLYVADTSANTIQKISPSGAVTLVAGTSTRAGSANGQGAAAGFNQPNGVVTAYDGTLIIADTANATIRVITPEGVVTTLAGSTTNRGNTDGQGTTATFSAPIGIAQAPDGVLYVTDSMNHTVRMITPAGAVTTIAGSAGNSGSTDGTGSAARLNLPIGVAVNAAGTVYVSDSTNNTIRAISPSGEVTTLAGVAGISGSENGNGSGALFNNPGGLVVDGSGNIYVADTGNSAIRKITPSGEVTTFAGLPGVAGLQDGTGTGAWFNQPKTLTIDGAGNLFVSDTGNAAIRKITPAGVVSTLTLTIGTAAPATVPPTGIITGTVSPSASPLPQRSSGSGSTGGAFALLLALLLGVRGFRSSLKQ